MALFSASTAHSKLPPLRVAMAGNPNSGKSTLFNLLTGLRQKTGNFPGVTVDLHSGNCKLENGTSIELIDLPGTYSLFPKSIDEQVSADVLCHKTHRFHPQVTLVVADSSNLKRSLYLCTQLIDVGMPIVLVLNMIDVAQSRKIVIEEQILSIALDVPVIAVNSKKGTGLKELKKLLEKPVAASQKRFITVSEISTINWESIQQSLGLKTAFTALVFAVNNAVLSKSEKEQLNQFLATEKPDLLQLQTSESVLRFKLISGIITSALSYETREAHPLTQKLDHYFTHKIWGFVIFLFVLFCIFQFIFTFSALPMEWIENGFIGLSEFVSNLMPAGMLNDVVTKGILAGLSGVVVFVPQIAFLFAFIAILEDSGYMARVSFIMDKLMRKFGLNGKSIIPLISGAACAVPAIMGARTISNTKERLITILVTPLMSCSARLPVYTLLIALAVPSKIYFGFLNLQGIVLMALYLIGFLAAIGAAFVLKFMIKSKERSYFIMELPIYRLPQIKQVAMMIVDKVKVFLFEAGKIIVAVSILLWFMASFAPGNKMEEIEQKYATTAMHERFSETEIKTKVASEQLAASYAGITGKFIEPAIAPLGFDWKIGISLVTSFAAREVFVGTMATIYSVGDESDERSIRTKMQSEINPETLQPVYSTAVAFSLMLFYAFAMQCMSTIAIVYKETGGFKWPAIQFAFMSVLAYASSFIAYNLLK